MCSASLVADVHLVALFTSAPTLLHIPDFEQSPHLA
jgi:hypothetical protein